MAIYSIFVLDTNSVSGLPSEGGGGPGGPGGAAGSPPFTITVNDSNWVEIVIDDTANDVFNEHNGAGEESQVLVNAVTLGGTFYPAGSFIFTAYDLSGEASNPNLQITTFHIGPVDNIGIIGPVAGLVSYEALPPGNYTFTVEGSSLEVDNDYANFVCFCKGTHILTKDGERTVETLSVGDKIETLDHGLQTVRWIGSSNVAGNAQMAPIKISAGALNDMTSCEEAVPSRDLYVSPQHRMLISNWRAEIMFGESNVLAAAKHLINDKTIRAIETDSVEYFHILFDTHEVIFAEGAPSESFHPGEQGVGMLPSETRNEIRAIFPELRVFGKDESDLAFPELRSFEARTLVQN